LYAIDLLDLLAVITADLGRPVDAARLLGAAERQRDLTGYVRLSPAREEVASVLADIQTAMSRAAFEEAMAQGRALALEDAVAFTQRGRGDRRRARSGWESLTPSEHRVASLVGEHLTNDEIATQLFVSIPTVKSHLNHIYAKLGLANRGQLAAAWHRRGDS
jgi:DNA-binding CsgD family transcriptional regulator